MIITQKNIKTLPSIAIATIAALLSALCLIIAGCTSSGGDIAGGTSVPNGIAGSAMLPGDIAAAGAHVRLYKSTGEFGAPQILDSVIADNKGDFRFSDLDSGEFLVEATLGNASTLFKALHRPISITTTADSIVVISDTLLPVSRVSGFTPSLVLLKRLVRIANSPYQTVPLVDGSFAFDQIPAGLHRIVLLIDSSDAPLPLVAAIASVTVAPGATATIDTLRTTSFIQPGTGVMINDFENRSSWSATLNAPSFVYNDSVLGGTTITIPGLPLGPAIDSTGAAFTRYCGHMSFTFGTAAKTFCGIGFYLGLNGPYDLTRVKRISFYIRGTGARCAVSFRSALIDIPESAIITDIAILPSAWTYYSIDLDTIATAKLPVTDLASWGSYGQVIEHLLFGILPDSLGSTSGEVWVDEIKAEF